MNDDNGSDLFYISKDEFKRRIAMLNSSLLELAVRYTKLLEKVKSDEKQKWILQQIQDVREDIFHNNEMMLRADIEDGCLLYYVDGTNNVGMQRCSKEEYQEIYKQKKATYIK